MRRDEPLDRRLGPGGGLTIDRRTVIGVGVLLASGQASPTRAGSEATLSLVAGTYEAEGGRGLYPLTFDGASGGWSVGEPDGAIRNASFGVRADRFGCRYLLQEQDQGAVGVWRAAPPWAPLGTAATGGAGPCHAAIDPAQTCLAVANYGSGSVAFYALDPRTGLPQGPPVMRPHSGHGPNAARQQGPHAHWVGFAPGARRLDSVDLGVDAVLSYRFDAKATSIGEARVAYRAPPGSGPRHLAYHPHLARAYLVCELANIVIALATTPDDTFVETQVLSTVPAGFAGESYGGHIAVNRAGTRLYVSNRGHDSLAVYAIDAGGQLALIEHVAAAGTWPRFFLLCEESGLLLVANERSGSVVAFAIMADGRLQRTGAAASIPGVVFLDRA